jgi:hypothetical protein
MLYGLKNGLYVDIAEFAFGDRARTKPERESPPWLTTPARRSGKNNSAKGVLFILIS